MDTNTMTDQRFNEIAAALECTENWLNGSISDADFQAYQAEHSRRYPVAPWTSADEAAMLAASDTQGTY